MCSGYRDWMIELFTQLSRDAGARDPQVLAKQMMLLYDGASVSSQMDGDPGAAASARAVAAALLDAAAARS